MYESAVERGVKKASSPVWRTFLLAIQAGFQVGVGCVGSNASQGNEWIGGGPPSGWSRRANNRLTTHQPTHTHTHHAHNRLPTNPHHRAPSSSPSRAFSRNGLSRS